MSNCEAYKKRFPTLRESRKFYGQICNNRMLKHLYPKTCNLIENCDNDANTANTGNVAKDDGVKPKYIPFYFNEYLVGNWTLRKESSNTGGGFDNILKLVCTNKEYGTDINTVYDTLAKMEIDKQRGKIDPNDIDIITEKMQNFEPNKLFNSIKAKLDQAHEEINDKSKTFVEDINNKLEELKKDKEENQIGGKRRYRHKTVVNNNRRLCTLCKKTLRRL